MTATINVNPNADMGEGSHGAALVRETRFGDTSVDSGEGRSQIAAAVVDSLNASGIPYCVLGTTLREALFAESDMDFVIQPAERRAVPRILASAASSIGAHLVQAMEYESTACYFVIAKHRGTGVSFLQPDCTADYRRTRRLWLYAGELLRSRGIGEDGMARPACAENFLYYLLKKVLKQSLTAKQWRKLLVLHGPENRIADIRRFWTGSTAAGMEWALLQNNRDWFIGSLGLLREELEDSPYQEPPWARIRASLADLLRMLRRILRPTGLLIELDGGAEAERMQLGNALARIMAPAFRRTLVLQNNSREILGIFPSLVRSTLVVRPARTLLGKLPGTLTISCRQGASHRENLELAVACIIAHLSERTARRLKLTGVLTHSHPALVANRVS